MLSMNPDDVVPCRHCRGRAVGRVKRPRLGHRAGRLAADLEMNDDPVVDPTSCRYARRVNGPGLDAPGMM